MGVQIHGREIITGDVDYRGFYGLNLQNIPDLASKGEAFWFDGVDDKVTVADDDNLSFGDGTTDSPFSIIVSAQGLSSSETSDLISKGVGGTNREYNFLIDSDNKYQLLLEDDSLGGIIRQRTTALSNLDQHNIWGATYDGTGSSSGIILYRNGTVVASSAADSGSYTAMENEGSDLVIMTNGDTVYSEGTSDRILLFNLALSTIEHKAYSSGAPVPFEYIGASQTEMMTTAVDRDFSAANDWTNAGYAAYSDDGGTLAVTADAIGDYALITIANLGTDFEQGKRYRLTYDYTETVAGFEFKLDGTATQTIGDAVAGTGQTIEFTAAESFSGADELWIMAKTATTAQGAFDNLSVKQIGCVLQLEQDGIGHQQWIDKSGNEAQVDVSGALPTNLPVNHQEKYVDLTVTGNTSYTLPLGYQTKSVICKETAGNALTGGLDIGFAVDGTDVVSGMAIGANATVLCTLIAAGTIGATHTTGDDTMYITDGDDDTNWNGAELQIRVQMQRLTMN